jgi:PhnB protein
VLGVDKPIKASEYGTVAVSLVVRDAKAAIDFYKKVLGAKHLYSLTMPNGGVAHAEFKIGDTIIMITDENPDWGSKSPQTLGGSPVTLNIIVDNPDATLGEAEKAAGQSFFLSPTSSMASGPGGSKIHSAMFGSSPRCSKS